ncbi:MAG: RluA family pseudouridine synthase [Alphaproteobacteria bacterium]|nr:RluA family pseudouridine synthase [Alphaproteobacteria bacterium]
MNSEEIDLNFAVPAEYDGQRADKVLSVLCEALSRSRLQSFIKEGAVFLNGEPLKTASMKVNAGDVFTLSIPEPVEAEPQPENIPLDIIYEDEDMLVINKRAGLVVHPGAGNWTGTMVNALLYHCAERLSGIGGVIRPGIVHRLDKDTSGLIMVAKNDYAHQALSAQLADRSLSRVYHALVMGVPMPIKSSVNRPIGRHRHNRLKMSVMASSVKEARTHYMVIQNYGEACSLVECRLETGRTHQIRVHMEALGYPLIGDFLYGPQPTALRAKLKKEGYPPEIIEEILKFPRQSLHAKELKCKHPRTGESLSFESPIPDDFSNLLKALEKRT